MKAHDSERERERANGSWGRGQEANGEATFVSKVIWVSDSGGERVGEFKKKKNADSY